MAIDSMCQVLRGRAEIQHIIYVCALSRLQRGINSIYGDIGIEGNMHKCNVNILSIEYE